MWEISELKLAVDHAPDAVAHAAADAVGLKHGDFTAFKIHRVAIDARRGRVVLNYTVHVSVGDGIALQPRDGVPRIAPLATDKYEPPALPPKASRPRPLVVGSGPCGLFCALLLARAGRNPILLERGKPAGARARDVTKFWRTGLEFSAESNVQFGEGGAGTFSDGKLYTQIKDREHRIPWILTTMVAAGAPEDILRKARPHIGTDRLITVVRHLREEIIRCGGEVRFETRLDRVQRGPDGRVTHAQLSTGETLEVEEVVLAIGHSARDTFAMLHAEGVSMEAKPLSIGVRVEHPQAVIDQTQYGQWAGHARLGTAPYKFVHHAKSGRTAYSFCMCPGGLVVAAGSESDGLVTNGMSSYARAEANANAGFMVDVSPADYPEPGPLGGIAYQRYWERRAFTVGGENWHAPIQTIGDFLARRPTRDLGGLVSSYRPGVTPSDLRECLPTYVADTLREAIPAIDRTLRGFAMPDGLLVAVETRSSSPLRITRDATSLQSVNTPGLYPAGEGAGYAGGIISAAVDGMKVAEAILR
jgi:uncharacterized protein